MLRKITLLTSLVLMLAFVGTVSAQTYDNVDAFTYQGYLAESGVPVDGTCDFSFGIFDAASGGSQIGGTQNLSGVPVSDGVFTVILSGTGELFSAGDRYLDITVDCGSGAQTLSPRQPITPAPLAMSLPGLYTTPGVFESIPNIVGGIGHEIDEIMAYYGSGHPNDDVSTNEVENGVYGAVIAGGFENDLFGPYNTISGGVHNLTVGRGQAIGGGASNTADCCMFNTVGGGNENFAGGDFSTVSGGFRNNAGSASVIGGGYTNTATGGSAVVGGGFYNNAQADSSVICGGGSNNIYDDYGVIGGGEDNTVGIKDNSPVLGAYATVGGGRGNQAQGARSTIAGGSENRADIDGTVSGGSDNYAENSAFVGGGYNNRAAAYSATGGGFQNYASGSYSAIGGGYQNVTGGTYSTVAGGLTNSASGEHATISGGEGNRANDGYSTVGGGGGNIASGGSSTIGGGGNNIASGGGSTIPGGSSNTASGDFSFAAGRRAIADDQGAFVWADSTDADVYAPGANTFSVSAGGGIWFGSTTTPNIRSGAFLDTSTGAYLSTGGTWTNNSDVNAKTDFTDINPNTVLEGVVSMPITSWRYIGEGENITHIGPMAQDFNAAFGLGGDNTSISTIDADGVALASIQALYAQNEAQSAVIADLTTRIEALERQLLLKESGLGAMALVIAMMAGYWFARRREGNHAQ